MKPWTLAALALAVALYAVALSRDVYDLTSPPPFAWHVVLRKAYSIAAFALLGFAARRAFGEQGRHMGVWTSVGGLACYSAAIEFGQWLHGSREGLAWNAVDVACGALGGLVATAGLTGRRGAGPPYTAGAGRPKTL